MHPSLPKNAVDRRNFSRSDTHRASYDVVQSCGKKDATENENESTENESRIISSNIGRAP